METLKAKKRKRSEVKEVHAEAAPRLEEGVNLVEKPGNAPALQSILAKELQSGGEAVWADVGNESSTYALAAHRPELLEKVRIGRAFTPFQHRHLVQELEQFVTDTTSVIVAPRFPSLYLEGATNDWETEELFLESWKRLKQLQQRHSLKLLVTAPGETQLSFKVRSDADKCIKVEKTVSGWKYSSEDFETRAYGGAKSYQTTINYWKDSRLKV